MFNIRNSVNIVFVLHTHGTQQLDRIDDPLAAMFEVESGERVFPAKKGPSHTSGDAMVIRRVVNRDLAVTWLRHGIRLIHAPASQ
jgi:hypothetical protein